jgi:hypothetical protein
MGDDGHGSDEDLRRQVNMSPRRIWGGPRIGTECAVCDFAVPEDQGEVEVQFLRNHGAEMLEVYHFHVRCSAARELERTKADSE